MGCRREVVVAVMVCASCWLVRCGGRAAQTVGAAGAPTTIVDAGYTCPPCGPGVCPKGQTLDYPNYGSCCSICRDCTADEMQAEGDAYDCGPAATRDYTANSCQTECIANDADACSAQLTQFFTGLAPLRVTYESTCKTNADCASIWLDSRCQRGCFGTLQSQGAAYAAQLQMLGAVCTACPFWPPPPPGPCAPTLFCLANQCVTNLPL